MTDPIMTPETFASLLAIAFASFTTPGPNNAMLASSGATFGLRATLAHMLGVALGFAFMMLLVGLLLGGLFTQSALFREVLRWGGAGLMLWVAWKIATAGGIGKAGARPRPMRFHEAAAFQWINPKAWVMALALTSQFVRPEAPILTALVVAATCAAMGGFSSVLWAGSGALLARLLGTPARLRAFNRTMAGLIALGVLWLLTE